MKDDEAIGQVKQEVVCPNCVHQFEVGKFVHPADLDPEPCRLMELGESIEKSVYQNGTRANEFYRLLLAGKRTFGEELYFIHAELRRWYAAGLASADAEIKELERELAVTKALAGVPIPDVAVGSAASTEGLAPPTCSECRNSHLNGGTCLKTVPCERFESSAIALAHTRRPSGWRVVIRSYQSGGGRNWMAELVAPNGKEKQPIGPYGHTAEEAQSWPIVRLLITALGATVEVAGKEQQ